MVGLNRSYSANINNQSENEDIPEKPNCNLGFFPIIILWFLFLLLIDIIDNIIYKSVWRHQNSHQW